jgi:hypothetical protein
VEANSTGGQGSRRAVAPSDDDNDDDRLNYTYPLVIIFNFLHTFRTFCLFFRMGVKLGRSH